MASIFDNAQYPALSQALNTQAGVATSAPRSQRGWLSAGLSSGVDQLQALGGAAISAAGNLVGSDTIKNFGAGIAQRNFDEAARNGRPDLESFPTNDLTKAPAWLGYQTAKQIPNIAAILLASRLPGIRSIGNALPKEALRAGASAPTLLGGGGLRAGMSFAEQRAAMATGSQFAKNVASSAAASYPLAVGSMYAEAMNRGNPTPRDALQAAALGVPYAALEAFQPRQLEAFVTKGLKGNIAKRITTGMAAGAAVEAPVEAAQTAMEMSFRPDLSVKDKMANIVEAAVTGGAVGGVLGGAGGIRKLKTLEPTQIGTDNLKTTVDQVLGFNQEIDAQQAQQTLPGIEPPDAASQVFDVQSRGARPFANLSDDDLQQGLAVIEQRGLTDNRRQASAFNSSFLPEDAVEQVSLPEDQLIRQQIIAEMGRRQAERPAAAEPVQDSFVLVDKANRPLQEQRAPVYNEPAAAVENDEIKTYASDLVGKSKAQWAQNFVNQPAADNVDVAANVLSLINQYDEAGRALPAPLKRAGQMLGLMDGTGKPRDLAAELNKAAQTNDKLWERVRATGQGQKEAAAFQNTKLRELKATVDALNAAQSRLASRPVVSAAEQAQSTGPRPSTAEEAAQVLAGAPPLTPRPTFEQQFRQRGIAPAPQSMSVEAPVVETPAAPVAAVRDASGNQFESLQQRFQQRGVPPTQSQTAPLPEAPSSTTRRFDPAGAVQLPSATQLVTGRSTQRQTAPSQGAAKFAPTFQQQFQTRGAVTKVGEPTPAMDINTRDRSGNPLASRAALVEQMRNAKLARIAQSDTVGQDLKQAASEALAGVESFAPNANSQADEVLAEYATRTGDVAFSARPASQTQPPMADGDFNTAFDRMTRSLPQVSRDAIVVVPTAADLPPVIARAAAKYNLSTDNVEGVVYDGQVYIVRDRVSSPEQLQELVNHEVFGHGGARALFGDQRQEVFAGAFRLAGGLEGLRSIARTFGVESQLNQYVPGNRDLTEEEQVALVDELLAQVAGVATGKFKLTLLSWASRLKTGLINVLNAMGLKTAASRLGAFDAADLAEMLTRMRQSIEQGKSMSGTDAAFKFSTPQGMLESTRNVITSTDAVQRMLQSRTWQERSLDLNKLHLYTSSAGHIVDYFGNLFTDANGVNWLERWRDANRARDVTEQRLAHLSKKVYAMYEQVQRENPEDAKKIGKLMGYTGLEIDPRRNWEAHTWLQDNPNKDMLRQHVAEANKIYRSLVQSERSALQRNPQSVTARATYSDFIAVNEAFHYAQQAVSLYNIMMNDEAVAQQVKAELQDKNPMDKFLGEAGTYDSPSASRDFWLRETDKLATFAKEYIGKQTGLTGDPAMMSKVNDSVNAIKARVIDITREQEALTRAPYFHIGRFGDYVLSFDIKRLANGKVDPNALDRVGKALEDAGITNVEIPRDAQRANAFIRFENIAQWSAAHKVAKTLEAEGAVSEISPFNRANEVINAQLKQDPEWAQRLRESIKATEFGGNLKLTEENKKLVKLINSEFARHVDQFFLNRLPDTALNKVLVHRNYVPGFSSDMIRSYVFRTQVGGRALANLYASAKMADATTNMVRIANDVRSSGDLKKILVTQNVVDELFKREASRPAMVKNNFIDTWRALNHAFFLGLSPSYILVNMTQVPVLLWPELSKRYGFVNAAKAIAKVTPTMMKIMSATLKEGGKLGWKNLPDASITSEVLHSAGIKGAQADFILRVVNSGVIDIGSQSRELGRVVEGKHDSKLEQSLRWASAAGYYSEMSSRLLAALAARELHGGNNEQMYKYVDETVRQSMLSYEQWNQARATGRMGLAGEFTPVMTSFMQYTFQLTEKLFREFHTAFVNSASSPEEAKAARRFLGSHLAAITFLAGSLGMPMATVFARVIDKMVDVLGDDDEPYNSVAAYRNWLADIFGKDVGEVIARGVPRAFGFDISERVGEQNLLPYAQSFSKLLTDRRTWDEASKDWALNTLGSPVSMILSVLSGGEKIASGQIMEGMEQMVPNAIKGPIKAYKLTAKGYTDTKGNALPMSAGATDIMWQLLGFNPARKAEYSEARGVQATLKGDMLRRSGLLRNRLVQALERGDMAAARDAYAEVVDFDRANPQFAVTPRLQSVLSARARERAVAQQSQTPFGTKRGLEDRSSFANFGN